MKQLIKQMLAASLVLAGLLSFSSFADEGDNMDMGGDEEQQQSE